MANPRIEDLRKRLEKEPGSRLFAQLAEELRKDGDLVEAIRVCREGLQKQPNYPSAHMTLGRALFDSGELAGARAELETVVKGAPDNILASRLLGECLERLGDTLAALARFRSTLALAPGDRQLTAKIQALEQGSATARRAPPEVTSIAATLIMPSPVVTPTPSPLRQAWPPPTGATQPAMPAPLLAAEPAEGEVEPEPPPIPVAEGGEETFELERPYEAPTLVGFTTVSGTEAGSVDETMHVGFVEGDLPLSAAEVEESFELEQRYALPETAAGPGVPPEPSLPTAAETTLGPSAEAHFDFDAGPLEPLQTWQAPPARITPEFPAPAPEPPASVPSAAELEMSTATLAELYLGQGVMDKAIEVYRQVLEREPGNERARTRLSEIQALDRQLREEEARAAAEGTAAHTRGASRRQAIERTIARLETLLAALKRN